MYEDDDDLIERVSDDEAHDDDAMDEGDGGDNRGGSGQQARSGRDVPSDDEPQLEGYARYVLCILYYRNVRCWCWCCNMLGAALGIILLDGIDNFL